MKLKKVVTQQYQTIVNNAAKQLLGIPMPKEGWIRTVRKALNMSGTQLANKLGVTRSLISQTEQAEIIGAITIKNMQNMAATMGCRLVYAIVPENKIEEIMLKQAQKQAHDIVKIVNNQMALEDQLLSNDNIQFEIDRLTKELLENPPANFWDE